MVVYLDNAKTTRVDGRVLEEILIYYKEKYGLPGGEFGHTFDEDAREAVERSREIVAKSLKARPEEIIFVSDEVEADNFIIKGFDGSVGCTATDRKSIIHLVKSRDGKIAQVDSVGLIREIPKTDLFVTHSVNFEIGTRQDLKAVIDEVKDKRGKLYVDHLHGFGNTDIDLKKLDVDFLTVTSHLIHGPKGVAAVFVREGEKVKPLIEGDFREFGKRGGMANVPSIVGFAKAVELLKDIDWEHIRKMKNKLAEDLLGIENTELNWTLDKDKSAPHILNLSFYGAEGESILLHCDFRGIIVSTGSGCYSEELQPSHVVLALGKGFEAAHGSIRFSFSKYNTMEDVEKVARDVPEIVNKIREISRGAI